MSLKKILLHAPGRIGIKAFWLGLAVFALFYAGQTLIMRLIGVNLAGFLLSLTLLGVNLYMLYCLFGKRLHDMGRSVALFFAMLAALIILAIILQLQAGGLEYFQTIMDNPERQNDPDWMRAQHDIYQQALASRMPILRWALWLPPVALTLFAGLNKGNSEENRYGPPPSF